MNSWTSVLPKFRVRGELQPVSLNTLREFESAKALTLPQSYCEYCQVFGPGKLTAMTSAKIAVPSDGTLNENFDLASVMEFHKGKDIKDVEAYCSDVTRWTRAIFFASGLGCDFFWDPIEETGDSTTEYAIYVCQRDLNIERIANSFQEFVNVICMESGVPSHGVLDDEPTYDARNILFS